MDLGNENVRVRIESDRISSLPDEIIHHILSFNDTKYAIQTSVLSSRWKLVWTTLPYLKFSTGEFRILPTFSKFVNRVLSRRNNITEVSNVDLAFRGRVNQKFVQNIANYAVSHNVQKVNIFACDYNAKEDHQFPICLFSSQSLKHLSLKTNPHVHHIFPLPQLPWDSPVLTTIELNDVLLCAESTTCLDLFSKCVSLMNLTLIRCYANGLKVMKISCPRLVHLTISNCWPTKYEVLAPNLSSFCYEGGNPLFLSTGGLNSLDNVNLRLTINSVNLNENKQTIAHEFMNLLHEVRNAKFVTLYGPFIEFLSLVLDLLEHQPSPFCNLKCLNIKEVEKRRKRTKSDMTNQVITYLLNSSPTATVNIEFQKVFHTITPLQVSARIYCSKKVEVLENQVSSLRNQLADLKNIAMQLQLQLASKGNEIVNTPSPHSVGSSHVGGTTNLNARDAPINADIGRKCRLVNWQKTAVAKAEVASTDPNDMAHLVPLGKDVWKVWVLVCLDPKAPLWRPNSEMSVIEDAVGSTVAWHKDFITFD